MKKFIKMASPAPKPNTIKKSPVGGFKDQQSLEKQNIRTVMQALHGCRKNCAQCRQEEEEWEPEIIHKEVKHA